MARARRIRTPIALAAATAILALSSCELDNQQLLQSYEDGAQLAAEVVDLDLVESPPVVQNVDEEEDFDYETFLHELGPSDIGAGLISGSTVSFLGTGGRVCVIVDPQSVWRDDRQLGESGTDVPNPYMSDFPYDDGDIDILAGIAAYYTGTPGVEMGDFFGSVTDDNGVDRAVDFNLCLMQDYFGVVGGTAGRATPEWCSFETILDVEYRVALPVFAVPEDDDRLKYALQLRGGECPGTVDECTLRGDYDPEPEAALPGGFEDVEALYCDSYGDVEG
jgi:hypothetical protein